MAKGCYIVQNALWARNSVRVVKGMWGVKGKWDWDRDGHADTDSVWGLDLLDLQLHEKIHVCRLIFCTFFCTRRRQAGCGGGCTTLPPLSRRKCESSVDVAVAAPAPAPAAAAVAAAAVAAKGLKKNACFGFFSPCTLLFQMFWSWSVRE